LSADLACLSFLSLAGTPTTLLGNLGREFLAEFRHRVQHRLGNFLDDVKLTQLVADVGPQLRQRLGVQRRTVGGDAQYLELTRFQLDLEIPQERTHVRVGWVVVEHAKSQAAMAAVIDN